MRTRKGATAVTFQLRPSQFACRSKKFSFSPRASVDTVEPAMATSLARQLQSIRSEVVSTLDNRKHEKVGSLLFDPEEAATQDYDSIFSLGLNGLQGLIHLEPGLQRFETTLFSETSKEIDRSIQTKEENDRWDSAVNEFLDLVAPHALSRETAKALEWLIRRFKCDSL
jgi:U3 small nucleolar RNA-associated protein 10